MRSASLRGSLAAALRSFVAGALLVSASACASKPPVAPPESPEGTYRLTLRLPPELPADGVLTTIPFSVAEVEAKVHQDPVHVFVWMERLRRAHDEDDDPRTVTLVVDAASAPSYLQVFFDTAGNGLETLFGPRSTVASALVRLPAGGGAGKAELETPPPRAQRESCSGPRLEKVELNAPELVRDGDDGRHVLCVFLPADYAVAPARRYPVVYALPGFSGLAADNDGFSARGLFDELAVGGVIVVGVETRIPEGTSYLARSERTGDWESYFIDHVLPEIDRRYRTLPRRAVYGHSTGGWNALSIALRHPDAFVAAAGSSPDPLDLDVWLFDGHGKLRPEWRAWARAERALGGRGQFTSWAASWSEHDDLVDDAGEVRPDVLARWRAHSPTAFVTTPAGASAARALSGRLFVTAGAADQFRLYEPSERFVQALRAQQVDVTWVPTELDHFGATDARFRPLVRFLVEQLAAASQPTR